MEPALTRNVPEIVQLPPTLAICRPALFIVKSATEIVPKALLSTVLLNTKQSRLIGFVLVPVLVFNTLKYLSYLDSVPITPPGFAVGTCA